MTGTELEKRTPMQQTLATITSENFIAKIRNALPENVSPERFVSVTVTAVKQNPELITADPDSLYNSIVRCAQDGLSPDGREAALVIFSGKDGKKVQYLPMIGGLRKVAAEDGFTLSAQVVCENDAFDYSLTPPWSVQHKPPKLGKDRGEIIGAYAIATDANGRLIIPPEVMDRAEIEQVRKVSRAADSKFGPWINWYAEMCRKTVARRLFKQLPRGGEASERAQRILHAADSEFEFQNGNGAMTEAEANVGAIAADLPLPSDEDTLTREEPAIVIEMVTDAQLNRIARLEQEYAGDTSALLLGAYAVDSAEGLTEAQAEMYEQSLLRLLTAKARAETKPVADGETIEDASFEDMLPPDVREKLEREKGS